MARLDECSKAHNVVPDFGIHLGFFLVRGRHAKLRGNVRILWCLRYLGIRACPALSKENAVEVLCHAVLYALQVCLLHSLAARLEDLVVGLREVLHQVLHQVALLFSRLL